MLTSTPETPVEFPRLSESRRLDVKKRFERTRAQAGGANTLRPRVYVSYGREAEDVVTKVLHHVKGVEFLFRRPMDGRDTEIGPSWDDWIVSSVSSSAAMLACIGPPGLVDSQQWEVKLALERGVRIIPVLVGGAGYEKLPLFLQTTQAAVIESGSPEALERTTERLARDLEYLLVERAGRPSSAVDPDDPQRGQWGESAAHDDRALTASVRAISDDYFEVTLEVAGTADKPLTGTVEFHLHPTFVPPAQTVPVVDGRAVLLLRCWGAFTVGAVADGGRTTLELDLAADTTFPQKFTAR